MLKFDATFLYNSKIAPSFFTSVLCSCELCLHLEIKKVQEFENIVFREIFEFKDGEDGGVLCSEVFMGSQPCHYRVKFHGFHDYFLHQGSLQKVKV